MNLHSYSDHQLIAELRSLVREERECSATVLAYLYEIEKRGVHLGLGFSSLFAFATMELQYSESEAISRIRAARLLQDLPAVFEAYITGDLSISVASRAQVCFQREQKNGFTIQKKIEVVSELYGKKIREADRILAKHFPNAPPRERIVPVNENLTKLELTVSKELFEKIEKILQLRSHKNPAKRLDLFLEDLVELGLHKWDPEHPRWEEKRRKAESESVFQ